MTGPSLLRIRTLKKADLPTVIGWARAERFAPGIGDVAINRHIDRQGLWVGCLGGRPIGCIAGVRYNAAYGFIGLFLVEPEQRGQGYGRQLWAQPTPPLPGRLARPSRRHGAGPACCSRGRDGGSDPCWRTARPSPSS